MQASAILVFAVCLHASATGLGQTVTFTGKDVPLKTVFTSIKKQTGYGVFYQNGEAATLEGTSAVTLDLKNVPLDLFLQMALRNQPLEYSVEGTTIFITKKEAHPSLAVEVAPATPIAEIHGRVTNDKGEPLANANITVKRTGRGTITDANGNFTLRNISSDDIITVSFIGYKPQSVSLHDRTSLSIFMEPTTNDLDKVVIQAYGTTTQRLATGNIGVVRAEDIAKQPVANVLQALQGQVAGVVVTNTSGYASAPLKIEIRGRNTIASVPSDPLYIIDGVPLTVLELTVNGNYDQGSQGFLQNGFSAPAGGQSPFFSINPSDIESIEILKDADATAIYGSRGADGVILITTKKGKTGKTHFDLNVHEGFNRIPRYYHMLNTQQYVAMREEALRNDGMTPDIFNAPDLIKWDTTRSTDWQRYIWGSTGKLLDAQASISGGDPRTTFRISTGYTSITDVLAIKGANQRGNLGLNVSHKSLNERFSISLNSIYSYAYINQIYVPALVSLPPNAPAVFDKKGNLNYTDWNPINNPFISILNPYSSKTIFFTSSLNLAYELIKGFTLKTAFGYNSAEANQTNFTTIASQNPAYNPTGSSSFGYNNIRNIIVEPQLTYSRFINRGKLEALIGASKQVNTTDGLYVSGSGYDNDALLRSISDARSQFVTDSYGEYKYASVFGRVNFNWENKYILNLNMRRDGSSRFGPGRQFGNFGSLGAAWIFSGEKYISQHLPFLSLGKIRGSYGNTGNDKIGDYKFLPLWQPLPQILYNGMRPLVPLSHSDSLLEWEVNRKLELALSLGFLKDRITVDVSWYRNRCNNQLVSFPTPILTGFTNVTANYPANVENKGWEINVNSTNISHNSFNWTTRFNIGINRNKLIAYPHLDQSPYASLLKIGSPLNIIYLLHYTGVNPQTGLYTFEDRNKDNQITISFDHPGVNDDRKVYDLSTNFSGGLTNNIMYNKWSMSIFFYFIKQLGRNSLSTIPLPGSMSNEPTEVLHRWQKSGDITNIAKFSTTTYLDPSYNNFQSYSDGIYTDASFIRLQNISLSYTIDSKGTKKTAAFNNCKLYMQGENIFTITRYKGIDPESQNFGSMPVLRTITVGFSCNF